MDTVQIGGMLLLTVPCAVMDMKTRKLSLAWMAGIALAGILFCHPEPDLTSLGINLAVAGVLGIVSLATRGAIGAGDVFLAAASGCILDWQTQLATLLCAMFFAAAVSAALLLMKMAGRKTEIPFAPCFLMSVMLQILAEWIG